jgi:CRISPR/Cas system-associated exonuclease Cas4 (RecB family)
MLANFFNQKQSIDSKFIVNKPFAIDIDGVSVEGHLDRVDTLDDGVEELVQYKSSLEKGRKLIKRPKKTKDNFELLFHSWAFKYVYGHLPSKTVLKTIDRTSGVMGNVAEFSVDDEDFKQTDQLVRESISAIQEGVFHGTPNWKSCTNCPYKSSCPVAYQGKKQAE